MERKAETPRKREQEKEQGQYILSDMVMRKETKVKSYKRSRTMSSEARIIYMTGQSS